MPNTITETMTEAASSSTASGRGSQPAERISTAVKAPAPSLGPFFSKYTEQYMIPTYLAPAGLQICITAFPLGLLAGLVLPGAVRFLLFDSYKLIGLGDSADSPATPWYLMPQLHIYLFAWCTFHLLEFTITAAYNPTRLYSDSFLLNNGIGYHIAHLFGLVEFALTASLIKPEWKTPGILTFIGLVLIVSGQMMRSLAMVHAHNNFSHILASKKRPDHELVKTGVYSYVLLSRRGGDRSCTC